MPRFLDADMRRLYGTGDFESVGYRFLEEPGKRVLAVDAVEKGWGPDYLRMGLGLSSDSSGDAFFNALASYRKTWLNSLGAEWRTDAQVGRTSNLSTEFYQPLNARGHVLRRRGYADRAHVFGLWPRGCRVGKFLFLSRKAGLIGADVPNGTARVDLGPMYTRCHDSYPPRG